MHAQRCFPEQGRDWNIRVSSAIFPAGFLGLHIFMGLKNKDQKISQVLSKKAVNDKTLGINNLAKKMIDTGTVFFELLEFFSSSKSSYLGRVSGINHKA